VQYVGASDAEGVDHVSFHTIVSTLPRFFSATARSFASFVSAAGVVRNQTGF
jgi:hypothetical protein